jgi:hypothetical protein
MLCVYVCVLRHLVHPLFTVPTGAPPAFLAWHTVNSMSLLCGSASGLVMFLDPANPAAAETYQVGRCPVLLCAAQRCCPVAVGMLLDSCCSVSIFNQGGSSCFRTLAAPRIHGSCQQQRATARGRLGGLQICRKSWPIFRKKADRRVDWLPTR